jgi:hypothetical protein
MDKDTLGRRIPIRTSAWKNNISSSLRRGKTMKCLGCGNDFYCQRYRYTSKDFIEKYGLPKYCSQKCSAKHRPKGQNRGKKIPKGSIAKLGEKNPMFGRKPNKEQLRGLELGRKKKRTAEQLRWNKTKCNLRRNTKRRYNGGKHTFREWAELREQYKHTCPCCGGKEPEAYGRSHNTNF